jgi:hypothetical protein
MIMQCVFFWSNLCCSQSGIDIEENLAKFGYKINMIFLKKKSIYVFGYLFEPCIEVWKVVINFGQIMAIEKFKYKTSLPLSDFNIDFLLYVANKKKVGIVVFSFGKNLPFLDPKIEFYLDLFLM